MSVQSEINRISGNVTAALAAIAEKGVTVGSGSNSDDLATLIAAIEAGGGGAMPEGVFYLGTGSFTPAETSETYNIFSIEELRSIASQQSINVVSYFSLVVRCRNLSYSAQCAAVHYVTIWVNASRSLQGVEIIKAYFSKNYSGTLDRVSMSSGEATMDATTGLTLNTTGNYKFAPTEYVWTLIGYTGS